MRKPRTHTSARTPRLHINRNCVSHSRYCDKKIHAAITAYFGCLQQTAWQYTLVTMAALVKQNFAGMQTDMTLAVTSALCTLVINSCLTRREDGSCTDVIEVEHSTPQ
eukprot:6904-Heterococcus_DN1.PRE.1